MEAFFGSFSVPVFLGWSANVSLCFVLDMLIALFYVINIFNNIHIHMSIKGSNLANAEHSAEQSFRIFLLVTIAFQQELPTKEWSLYKVNGKSILLEISRASFNVQKCSGT